MSCLFCNCPERSYKPSPDVEYICSSCVQLLLQATKEDLQRALAKAEEMELENKVLALKSFIVEDEHYGKTKNSKRDLVRKRSMRTARPTRNKVRA